MKKFKLFCIFVIFALLFVACGTKKEDAVTLRVGSLKGPTTMGLVNLMDENENGKCKGSYSFQMVTAADELVGSLVKGDLDIALIPANLASVLYNTSNAEIQVVDINTLGVLYGLSTDTSVTSVADLKGKTVYTTGKGTTPDFVLRYLLSENGLSDADVTIEFKSEATEVLSVLAQTPGAVGILPQPFATAALSKVEGLAQVLDLTKEWENTPNAQGSTLVTGVTVCQKKLLEENPDAVKTFLEEHKKSSDAANADADKTAELIEKAGIVEKAALAKKSLPFCNITCITGNDMEEKLGGYLNVLYSADPSSVGGQLPDEAFYYQP